MLLMGFFFSCFHEQKFNFSNFFLHFSICTKKWLRMNDFLKIREYFFEGIFFYYGYKFGPNLVYVLSLFT